MVIEFSCPACGRPMRCADEQAGKIGRCPQCSEIVPIPAASAKEPAPASAEGRAENASKIAFDCPECAQLVRTPPETAGKRGRCPHCRALIPIPAVSDAHRASDRTSPAKKKPPAESSGSSVTNADDRLHFDCPSCSGDVAVPQALAGKKGRCPHCSAVVPIPGTGRPTGKTPPDKKLPEKTPTASAKPAREAASSSSPSKTASRTFTAHCPACSAAIKLPAGSVGKKGRCPSCQHVFRIPAPSEQKSERKAVPRTPDKPVAAKSASSATRAKEKTPAARDAVIQFPCATCGHQIRAPKAAAGKSGNCPKCGTRVDIPSPAATQRPGPRKTGTAAAAAPRDDDLGFASDADNGGLTPLSEGLEPLSANLSEDDELGLAPLPDDSPASSGGSRRSPVSDSGLTPLGDSGGLSPLSGDGLTPIPDDSGLTPLGGGTDGLTPVQDDLSLTPLDDGGLTPLGDTGGLTPLGDDGGGGLMPLGDVGGGDAGFATAPAGAYTAPSTAPAAPKPRPTYQRSGLPWEREQKSTGVFFKTVSKILFSPNEAFGRMRRRGGLLDPFSFAYSGGIFVSVVTTLIYAVIMLGAIVVAVFAAGENLDGQGLAMAVGIVLLYIIGVLLFSLIAQLLLLVISSFLSAAIHHLLLMLVGGAREEFEVTYRVVTYVMGATTVAGFILGLVPFVGPLITLVIMSVLLILGLGAAHEIPRSKAAMAVLLPYALCCAVLIPLWAIVFLRIMSQVMPG